MRVTLDIPDDWIYSAQERLRTRGPEDTLRAAVRYVLGHEVFGWQGKQEDARFADWEDSAVAIEHLRREELNE